LVFEILYSARVWKIILNTASMVVGIALVGLYIYAMIQPILPVIIRLGKISN
jgi:hypothetical protein